MNFEYEQYRGTRVRIQRIEDAKLFRGWVHEFTETALHITFEEVPEISINERAAFELQGHHQNVFVIGEVREIAGLVVIFRLTSNLRLSAPTESVRFQASRFGVYCDLIWDDESHEVEVNDISTGGVGIISPVAVDRAEVVELRFRTRTGEAICQAEVRYCRPLADDSNRYRIGCRLEFADRVSKGRWFQLFPNAA